MLEYVPKVVNEDVNKELVREVEEDEIKNAVFQLGLDRMDLMDCFIRNFGKL